MKVTTRPEDMSPDGKLTLIRQDDGDIIIEVREGTPQGVPGAANPGQYCQADIEFCNSGGHSPWTLQALYALQEAMEKDERREPWPARAELQAGGICPRTNEKCSMDCRMHAGLCWAAENDVDVS